MKSKLIAAVIAIFIISFASHEAHAQAELQRGNLLLNAGVGFGYYYAGGASFNLNGEYSVTEELGIGAYFAFTRWDNHYFGYNYDYTFIDLGARASYHFARILGVNDPKFDPYAGVFLGFVSSSYKYDGPGNNGYNDAYDGTVRTGIHIGARYYFSDQFAGYGELGVGLSPLVLGITYKL